MHQFPQFDPWGQGSSHGGSIDTIKAWQEQMSSNGVDLRDLQNGDKDCKSG